MTRVGLTGRQRLVYEFVRDYIVRTGIAPTFREMSAHFGNTVGSLHEIVGRIVERGWLVRSGEANMERNIALPPPDVVDDIEAVAVSLDGYAGQTDDDWIIGILRGTAHKLREIAERSRQ